MFLFINWLSARKRAADRDKRNRKWEAKTLTAQTVNQGVDAADTELVKFILSNYPARTFLEADAEEQDALVNLIAKENGFTFFRTAPVRKQVVYRFKTDMRLPR